MAKITYTKLQKKYAGQIVILNKSETKVLASGDDPLKLDQQMEKKGFNPNEYIFYGPVPDPGVVYIL